MDTFIEYLNPADWSLHVINVDNEAVNEDWILVPEGAEIACDWCNDCDFYKLDGSLIYTFEQGNWELCEFNKEHLFENARNIHWSRYTQPEELPFIDDEPKTVNDTLAERQSQYGSFKDVANTTQLLLDQFALGRLSSVQREALHMICSKLSRIAHGDVNHIDSWHDIAGYATLVVNDLEGDSHE